MPKCTILYSENEEHFKVSFHAQYSEKELVRTIFTKQRPLAEIHDIVFLDTYLKIEQSEILNNRVMGPSKMIEGYM